MAKVAEFYDYVAFFFQRSVAVAGSSFATDSSNFSEFKMLIV